MEPTSRIQRRSGTPTPPSCLPNCPSRTKCPILPSRYIQLVTNSSRQVLNSRRICEICSQPGQPYSVPTKDWDEHKRSKIHKR